jgi:beta-lactamase regulating signal transducer with metallopeptidase domain
MNAVLEPINSTGKAFVEFAGPMLIQSSVLILILLAVDLLLRKKVRAVLRYWMWMLVLIKLCLPTSLSVPMSFGYWFGNKLVYAPAEQAVEEPPPVETSTTIAPLLTDLHIRPAPPMPASPVAEPVVEEAESMQPPAHPAESVASLSWQGAAFLAWLVIAAAMALLLLQRALFVRGLVAQAKAANRRMSDILKLCRADMRVSTKVDLKVSANATSPAVCGLFRPVILVPENLALSLDADRLRTVLVHELAHIKRGDLWVNLAQTFLQIVYFYNPLLWLANAMIRRVREQAVDEAVLVAMGRNAQQYPQTLVDVAKLAFKRPALSLRLIGVFESKNALKGRIKHILNRPMPKSSKLGILGLVTVLIAGGILLPMAKSKEKDILALAEKLRSDDETVWKEAAEELQSLGPKVAEPLSKMFGYAPADVRALDILKPMATDEHVQAVMLDNLKLDRNRYPNTVHCSLIILAESGNRAHVRHITQLFEEDIENGADPTMAAIALGQLGGDDAYIALRDAVIRDVSPTLRWVIAEQLVKSKNPDAISYLEAASDKLAGDKDGERGPKRRVNLCIYELSGAKPGFSNEFTMPVYDRNASSFGQYIGGNLSTFGTAYIKLDRYGLKVGDSPEEVFERQGKCAFYMKTGHEFVGVRDTVIAPISLPYLDPEKSWTWIDRLELLYPRQIAEQILQYRKSQSSNNSIKLKEGGVYGVVTPENRLIVMRVRSLGTYTSGAQSTTLTFTNLGSADRISSLRNISLQPGQQTDVDIETRNDVRASRPKPLEQHIQASPLSASDRELIKQVVDLAKQVEKKYPDEATHWPAGAGLYHVDEHGQVTVWHYRALWRRSRYCTPDEVGWGSSRLVDATGMYYLPDGRPLQSRWSERGGGMKDIRVKIGRAVGESEHLPVIHKHRLAGSHELFSRDGLKKSILLQNWKDKPIGLIVRVDRPTRLSGWWVGDGDIKTDTQHFEEYDQLTIHIPPGQYDGPMLVTVELPESQVRPDAATPAVQAEEGNENLLDDQRPAQVPPPGRYSLSFDGKDDYLEVAPSPSLKLEGPFTVELWIKPRFANETPPAGHPEGYGVMNKGVYEGGPGRVKTKGFGIKVYRHPKETEFFIDYCTANQDGIYAKTWGRYLTEHGISEWRHFHHAFDTEKYTAGVDCPLTIGEFLIPTEHHFRGQIGEIRIWNGTRTREEIRRYKDSALTGNELGLTACWTFEAGRGQIAKDISPNKNHARLGSASEQDDADPAWAKVKDADERTDVQAEYEGPGSKLEFRIALDTTSPDLSTEELEHYRKDLAENGPVASDRRTDEFAWFPVRSNTNLPPVAITEEYEGKKYLLLYNRQPYVMTPEQDWALVSVEADTDAMGRLAVHFAFDEKGADLFYKLTKANLNKALAAVIDGQVVSAPTIMSAIRREGVITGRFTEQEVDKMIQALRKGMSGVEQRQQDETEGQNTESSAPAAN